MEIGIYTRGVSVSGIKGKGNRSPCKRGIVRGFSKTVKKRLGWTFMQGHWSSMISLTYHEKRKMDYKIVKKELGFFLQRLRYREIQYLWVLEWQKRGMPHFHVWMDKKFDDVPLWEDTLGNSWRPLMKNWLKITGQDGDEKAVEVGLHQWSYVNWNVNVKSNYAMKYADKSEQKMLPENIKNFGRWAGWSRGLKLIKELIDIGGKEDKYLNKEDSKGCKQTRRIIKRIIEKKTKYRFSKDKVKSRLAIKFIMKESLVECVERIIDYYLFGGMISKGFEIISF